MDNNRIIQNQKNNIKLYTLYKVISWDLLFYYTISFLFLTTVKGISAAQVLFSNAFYPIFKFLLQIPCTTLVDRIGKRKSIILGNLFVAGSILMLIVSQNLTQIIFSYFLSAFGYNLKGLSESNLLFDSIPKSKKRNDLFSKIDGKASSYYYYLDAISSSITGYLFVFNGYLPMIICFIFCILSTLLSLKFTEPNTMLVKSSNNTSSIKHNLSDLKHAFKFIFKSNRLRSLIIFYSVLTALLSILTTLRSSILTDIALPAQYFGIVFAILQIVSGIASNNSGWFHNRFRNKTLKVFALCVSISMIFIGLSVICNLSFGICLEVILIMFTLQYIAKGPFYTLIQRYLRSFTTSSIRVKISAASDLCYSIVSACISFFCSALLDITNTANVFVISGCIFTVFFIFLLDYMRDKVGLKPEEYDKKDIEFIELH